MKLLAALLLSAMTIAAQNPVIYQAVKTTSLSGTAEVVTVQQIASGKATLQFQYAWVYCSVACSFTLEMNGTAATATTLTAKKLPPQSAAPTATAWSGSDVGTGSYVSAGYQVAAGQTFTIDIGQLYITKGAGTAGNLSIRTSAITGTAEITIQWTEKQP